MFCTSNKLCSMKSMSNIKIIIFAACSILFTACRQSASKENITPTEEHAVVTVVAYTDSDSAITTYVRDESTEHYISKETGHKLHTDISNLKNDQNKKEITLSKDNLSDETDTTVSNGCNTEKVVDFVKEIANEVFKDTTVKSCVIRFNKGGTETEIYH